MHKYEEDFKVFIQQDRENWILLGEKGNVEKCEASIQDALDEVEETVQFDRMILFALTAHEHRYRRMIESDCHVKTRLVSEDSLCLIGGKNSVKQAERAIRDLFKSGFTWFIYSFTIPLSHSLSHYLTHYLTISLSHSLTISLSHYLI